MKMVGYLVSTIGLVHDLATPHLPTVSLPSTLGCMQQEGCNPNKEAIQCCPYKTAEKPQYSMVSIATACLHKIHA